MMEPVARETRILTILTAILATCFFCGAMPAMIFVNSPGLASDLAAMVPTRRPTATATATLIPTATPTSLPTFTPRATRPPSTANLLLDPALDRYMEAVVGEMDKMGQAAGNVARLSETMDLKDPVWVSKTKFELNTMRQVYETLSAMTPPPQAADFHRQVLEAESDCARSAEWTAKGLDSESLSDFQEAARWGASCSDKLLALKFEITNLPPDSPPAPVSTPGPTFTALPSLTPIPTLTPIPLTATFTPFPAAPPAVAPPPASSGCNCSSDSYNCDDPGAVSCYNYCRSVGAGDIHRLDRDGDGVACE